MLSTESKSVNAYKEREMFYSEARIHTFLSNSDTVNVAIPCYDTQEFFSNR